MVTLALTAVGYSEQASVGSWPWRIGLTLAVLVTVLLILAGFRRGWRRRRDSQTRSGLGVFPTRSEIRAEESESECASFHAKYIGTAKSSDRFTRIIAGGGPAQADLLVSDSGIEVVRHGEQPFFIFAGSIVDASSGNGMLQKAYSRHGLLMVTWRWCEQDVTSGFWLAKRDVHLRALAEIERVVAIPITTAPATGQGATQGGRE
jgi:hypothetical protein